MNIKKIRRRRIVVSPAMRKELAQKFGVTVQCVGCALRYSTEGFQPEMIRQAALDMGGIDRTEVMIVDKE